tara:strand:- start:2478 stop:3056 length:579 start_codon:yes stop_codon:yes gene_type:complete
MNKPLKIHRFNHQDLSHKNIKKIFKFLTQNIKNTTYQIFGYNFFFETFKLNYKNSFYITHNKKIISYISYVDIFNETKIKDILIKNIFKHPMKNFFLIFANIKFFFKIHKRPKKFIQLMHLIIKNNEKKNQNLKKRIHYEIEKLHRKVTNSKYSGIYASFENDNFAAAKYYKKNNFKVFKKNFFYSFVKKEI